MKKSAKRTWLFYGLFILCALYVFTGCADKSYSAQHSKSSKKSYSSQDNQDGFDDQDGQDDMPSLSNSIDNYSDIELPSDMKWDGKRSLSINTDSFSGGIMQYSGRVEIYSLKEFIIGTMKKHRWKHVGEAASTNMLLAFTKPNKTCMVVLSEGFGGSLGHSYATLYVTVDKSASKRSNLYDEPMTK